MSCWAAEDIPTNRAEKIGYEGLTNAELIAILIGSGSQDCDAVSLSRMILDACGNNLNSLARLPRDIYKMRGLGKIKAARIAAALELGKRREEEAFPEKPELSTAVRIYNHHKNLEDNEIEEFWVSLLNQHYGLIKDVKISQGGLTETPVDVRIIMREAVINNATIIACVHNHPSGRTTPSRCDDELTRSIRNACELMRIRLADHVIVGQNAYYSYKEAGKL